MELFSISCTTCQQRLKVRNAAAIGQIVICPKCGSMVLVEPPADWRSEPPVAAAVPQTVTAPASVVEPAASDPPTPGMPPAVSMDGPPQPPAPHVLRAVPVASVPPPSPVGDPLPLVAEPLPPAPAEVLPPPLLSDDVPPPLVPDDTWISPAAQQRRQWMLTGLAATAGVGMALGLVWLAASRGSGIPAYQTPPGASAARAAVTSDSDNTGPAAAGQAETPPPSSPPSASPPSASPPSASPPSASPPSASLPPAEAPAEAPLVAPAGESPAAPASDSAVPAEGRGPEDGSDEPMPVEPSQGEPTAAAATAAADPSLPAPAAQAASPETTTAAAFSQALEAFAPFVQDAPYAPPDAASADQAVPPATDVAELADSGFSAPRPEPRVIDVAARLQDRIPQIQMLDVPLIAFLSFITDFSTIPLTVDPDALALLRLTPNTPVQVQAKDAVVAELLTAALQPLRLGYVQVGDQLIVTRPPASDGQFRVFRHPVEDLIGSDQEQLDELIELILGMVERHSWDAQGGPGSLAGEFPALVIQNQDPVLFRTLLFCERWRVARGLPLTTNLDPVLCGLEPTAARARPLLDKPLHVRHPEPTSLLQILGRIAKESGLQILVDWQALGELGWTPQAETTCAAENVPAGQALDELLRPMDLTYRVLDAQTIQVTSPEAVAGRWDVEFYPVADLLAAAPDPPLAARVRQALEQAGAADDDTAFHLDPLSGHLIVAASQPWQQRVAELLQSWRGPPP